MNLKSLFILSLIVLSFLSWKSIDQEENSADMPTIMRDIGHQLLLRAGDSSSRVLPVKKIADNDYQITFESPLAFEPDMLVEAVRASLNSLNLSSGYAVNVWTCNATEIVYGFEIFGDKQKDVVPCLGRALPEACYEIRITFQKPSFWAGKYTYVAVSFLFSLVLAFLVLKKSKDDTMQTGPESKFIQLGKIQFFYGKRLLKLGKEDIELTSKENQVLRILASSPNQILDRDRLQKEVWENEGVLVGRSLDVFISKLRKKLEADPGVRIVNIHGKGYKLEIQ